MRAAKQATRQRDTPFPPWLPLKSLLMQNRRSRGRRSARSRRRSRSSSATRPAPPRSGRSSFPRPGQSLIAELIRRDAPYYDPEISPQSVESMNRIARELGLLSRTVGYEDGVWKG